MSDFLLIAAGSISFIFFACRHVHALLSKTQMDLIFAGLTIIPFVYCQTVLTEVIVSDQKAEHVRRRKLCRTVIFLFVMSSLQTDSSILT